MLNAYMHIVIIAVGKIKMEKDINVSFMVVGHTRCSVDGGFGLAKKKFRCSDCDTPEQLSATIDASAEQNKACLYEWQWRNWDAFLSQKFRRLSGITKFQHFRFSSEFPGSVKVKETVDLKIVMRSRKRLAELVTLNILPSLRLVYMYTDLLFTCSSGNSTLQQQETDRAVVD